MRKIFLLLNLNLALFILSIISNIYIIFIGGFHVPRINLDFLEGLQLGNYIDEINSSVSFTVALSSITFIINLIVVLMLTYSYSHGAGRKFFNFIHKKNKFLFEWGVYAINPYLVKERVIDNRSRFIRIVQFLFYFWIIFVIICFVFNIEFIQLPKVERFISLITNYKIFLFLFNIILFIVISFMFLGFIFSWMLTLISIFDRKEI